MKTKTIYKVVQLKFVLGETMSYLVEKFDTEPEADAFMSGFKRFNQQAHMCVVREEVVEHPDKIGFFDRAVEVNNIDIDLELLRDGFLPDSVMRNRLIQLREIVRTGYVHKVEEVHDKLKMKIENKGR